MLRTTDLLHEEDALEFQLMTSSTFCLKVRQVPMYVRTYMLVCVCVCVCVCACVCTLHACAF